MKTISLSDATYNELVSVFQGAPVVASSTPTPAIPTPVITPSIPTLPAGSFYKDMGWATGRINTSGVTKDGIIVVKFRTPSQTSPAVGHISAVEYSSINWGRLAVLSKVAGDFTIPTQPAGSSYGPFNAPKLPYSPMTNSAPIIMFRVGGVSDALAVALEPDTDYYFNIKTTPMASGPCNMFVELAKPSGL